MPPPTIRTPENQEAFLDALSTTGSVTAACEVARIGRQSAYDWRRDDAAFAAAWAEAQVLGTDALEDEATRRATVGVEEPIFHQGVVVGHVRRHSDALLMFLLKARDPERFKERTSSEHRIEDLRSRPREDLERELAELQAFQGTRDAPGPV